MVTKQKKYGPLVYSGAESTLSRLCRTAQFYGWGLYVSYDPYTTQGEILEAAPFLTEHMEELMSGEGYFLFENENDLRKCYNSIVGMMGQPRQILIRGQSRYMP